MCSTFVPLGIKSFDNKFENKYISLSYTLSDNAQEVTLQIRDGEEEIYKKVITSPSEVSKGQHFWSWDGFDKNGILDTARLTKAKRLNYKISVKRKNNIFSETQYFKLSYNEVNWVDVKINRSKKRIDVTLRVDLKDGGAGGLTYKKDIDPDPKVSELLEVHPWENISKEALLFYGKPPITQQLRSYKSLERLALDGIEKYWSRNKTNKVGINVKINNDFYEVFIKAERNSQGLSAPVIVYETNSEESRSRNFFLSRRLFFSEGYLYYSDWKKANTRSIIYKNKGWYYRSSIKSEEKNVLLTIPLIEDFKITAAHEIGHQILVSFAGKNYSYSHEGTSHWSLFIQEPNDNATEVPKIGEINLMKYYTNSLIPERVVVSEKDLLGLLWLSKIEIKRI